jgi:hypothetical protein
MAGKQLIAVTATALLLTGVATMACAETAKAKAQPEVSFTTRDSVTPGASQWGVQSGRKSMQWDASKGRWGLKLDMEQPARGEMAFKDVQAGAYFKVTPSLRVGGAVNLGDRDQVSRELNNRQPAPRVRLESSLKF